MGYCNDCDKAQVRSSKRQAVLSRTRRIGSRTTTTPAGRAPHFQGCWYTKTISHIFMDVSPVVASRQASRHPCLFGKSQMLFKICSPPWNRVLALYTHRAGTECPYGPSGIKHPSANGCSKARWLFLKCAFRHPPAETHKVPDHRRRRVTCQSRPVIAILLQTARGPILMLFAHRNLRVLPNQRIANDKFQHRSQKISTSFPSLPW